MNQMSSVLFIGRLMALLRGPLRLIATMYVQYVCTL